MSRGEDKRAVLHATVQAILATGTSVASMIDMFNESISTLAPEPGVTFAIAELECSAAYATQGGPAKSPEERYEQQQARERRGASAFEELYCLVRDIADDWHREAIRRRNGEEPGQYNGEFCDANAAVEKTMREVFERSKDWDY